MTVSRSQPSNASACRCDFQTGECQGPLGCMRMKLAADEIDRLSERVLAYKGQVEAGAAEIAALKARVAKLEAAIQKDNSHG